MHLKPVAENRPSRRRSHSYLVLHPAVRARRWNCCLLFFVSLFGFSCVATAWAFTVSASVTSISVSVDPVGGQDTPSCNVTPPCKSVAYAIQNIHAAVVNLSPAIFNESTVSIRDIATLFITGVPSSTIFDCSRRLVTSGPAFSIINSSVSITGVIFQSCSNLMFNGGALSASGSSIVVLQCAFINCSAASGGALSVKGLGAGLHLNVQNSNFTGNSAIGGQIGCPDSALLPCSTWGGAIAAFEMLNVTISGCVMVDNSAWALVPSNSSQAVRVYFNAVAAGGCIAILFLGNTSGSSVIATWNTFLNCSVDIKTKNKDRVDAANGLCCASLIECVSFEIHLIRA
jgi:hypothetical protein